MTCASLLGDSKLEKGGKHLERQARDMFCVLKMEFGYIDLTWRLGGFGNNKELSLLSWKGVAREKLDLIIKYLK